MVHGQIYPVTRNMVQYGQVYLNGDIVQMPDYLVNSCKTDIWDAPPYCGECGTSHTYDMDCNKRWYGQEVSPIRTRERARCYSCKTGTGVMRRVTGHFVTSQNFDPTQAYRLVCGHSTIG